ncbi:MAG: 4'-phosphopantetheinyl transferase superfamily protein [Armatimonadetes bacterium]|nr:4'-phosphopantetheinyl transferase superfamily protein [Armatimonadota bacterium]
MESNGDVLDIAGKFFSPSEAKDIITLPEKARQERFYDYWTLKESYLKARGMGLSIPLNQFSLQIKPDVPSMISLDTKLNDHLGCWQFWLLKPTYRHKMVVAVRSEFAGNYRLTIRKVIPMMAEEPLWPIGQVIGV